jgi:NitT/TauT family transport system ATP-binding protein
MDAGAPVVRLEGPLIRLEGVGKTFRGRSGPVPALVSIDLEVARGEFVAVIGPSGCGKSTLLRLVGGLVDADAGTVTVEDEAPLAARRAKQFGLVPQTPALLPWRSVRDNVRLLAEVNRGADQHAPMTGPETLALVEEVGLGQFLDAYPRELSGGMQQRVSLVRAFALGAPILLMDEPFASLDEITRTEMRYLLARVLQHHQVTVLFVTHAIAEAVLLADRVVVLAARPGRVTAVIPIDLPRPRTAEQEDTMAFLDHVKQVRRALAVGSGR